MHSFFLQLVLLWPKLLLGWRQSIPHEQFPLQLNQYPPPPPKKNIASCMQLILFSLLSSLSNPKSTKKSTPIQPTTTANVNLLLSDYFCAPFHQIASCNTQCFTKIVASRNLFTQQKLKSQVAQGENWYVTCGKRPCNATAAIFNGETSCMKTNHACDTAFTNTLFSKFIK